MERFVFCSRGCEHWGALGAAGVLLRAGAAAGDGAAGGADADARYLLVLRHPRSHHGGTWALPGGALQAGESALAGALREAEEELGPLPAGVSPEATPTHEYVDDHGEWSYTTLVLNVADTFEPAAANWETAGWRWVSASQALTLPLLPALRAAWPALTGTG
ncbi:NUDIX domain-containing protein [Parafrankia discariae]|uniref:NUDIX domain-containing protein n=1 Tax=Parafrankia discariae TaxID=365528 RepID=UPI000361DDC6|nr:NUDIX hydrolase [Parafrankia discariae]